MANLSRNFVRGRMNKSVDERLIPNGEYVDALNVRMGSTEESEIGVIENTKGNKKLTTLVNPVDGSSLSNQAVCIGAYADSANETMYWFVHDPDFTASTSNKCDMIVSYNTTTQLVRYHVVSCTNPSNTAQSTLNFSKESLVVGVNLIDGLLFFTDNLNQPRYINVNRQYPLPSAAPYVDDSILEERIRVIRKPPLAPPTVNLIKVQESVNFIDERFACFAYRYKYDDDKYSATSPFTAPAFVTDPFDFSIDSFLNEGMTNNFNAAEIGFNTGSELVKGIDLLYKDASDGVIKVIKKIDKEVDGIPDNDDRVFTYDKSKIFTILPESEILRLYDNVPIKAKAQTLMGNRLMYGNYVEGYDLTDSDGRAVNLNYSVELDSSEADIVDIPETFDSGLYTFNPLLQRNIQRSVGIFDFSAITAAQIQPQARIEISMNIRHKDVANGQQFDNNGSFYSVNQITPEFQINFDYSLPPQAQGFQSMSQVFSLQSFIDAIGTLANIQPLSTSCDGATLNDNFNCQLPTSLSGNVVSTGAAAALDLNATGVDASSGVNPNTAIVINPFNVTLPNADSVAIQIPCANWVTKGTNGVYEYFEIVSASATFIGASGSKSLHSNRDYEFGIVYMDEYGRSSTTLVSEANTIHVPCENSPLVNRAKIEIPPSQKPPYWASKYKFVARASKDTYETIYSNIYFVDEESGNGYILLEGENISKVEVGDRYIVKKDNSGPAGSCKHITVLDKQAQSSGFLGGDEPAGLYMEVKPNNIDLAFRQNNTVDLGLQDDVVDSGQDGPVLSYNVNEPDPAYPAQRRPMEIPAGSRVKIFVNVLRHSGITGCGRRQYTFDETISATKRYANFYDFFIGEGLDKTMVDQQYVITGPLNPKYYSPNSTSFNNPTSGSGKVDISFGGNANQFLRIAGPENCGRRDSLVKARIQVFKSDDVLIFETLPVDTNPDIFLENDNVFDIVGGIHKGTTQDQSSTQPAICFPNFYNCYSFGNGAESYKIRDSIVGPTFDLGNRVFGVQSEDYEEVHRFADITYSGIYNDESNVNKLNEFNLGLLNFKKLEESYGIITLLDGRETDVLTLQEDKVSYVLSGKNLLSDAAAGGAITSVPEVLGTQIARVEDYGNSFNPESYVQWGENKYFTDAKRGAVIQLKGSGAKSEQLTVVSELGMRSWFRDLFIDSFETQKLGGFDPYMNEYVLSSNVQTIPTVDELINCGTSQSLSVDNTTATNSFDIALSGAIGTITVSYNVSVASGSGSPLATLVLSCGSQTSPAQNITATGSGSFTFTKTTADTIATITLTQNLAGDKVTLSNVLVSCPTSDAMEVIEVVLTNNDDSGDSIHVEYEYSTTTPAFTSIRRTDPVLFGSGANPLVSRYNSVSGNQGSSLIPFEGSSVTVFTNKFPSDTFDVDNAQHRVGRLFSPTLYQNNATDINSLLGLATFQSLTGTGAQRSVNFTASSLDTYMYIIWDLRSSSPIELCRVTDPNATVADVCCDETCFCLEQCTEYQIQINSPATSAVIEYIDCSSGETFTVSKATGSYVCSRNLPSVISVADGTAENVNITIVACGVCEN